MTTLKELFDCPWQDVKEQIIKLYPDQANNILGYNQVYNALIYLEPVPSEMVICVEEVKDWCDGTIYSHVSGEKEGDEYNWSLCLTKWESWLGMEVSQESLANYSTPELLAHILFEMTYMGYTNDEVKDAANRLSEKCQEVYENTE